ncbi:MAG: ABC-type transport auxiliary lipoprotein family protein [Pseudomonadota bacterium]
MIQRALSLVALGALGACTLGAAAPKEHFYRLPASSAHDVCDGAALEGAIWIDRFDSSPLHGERAIIHAHDDGLTLTQHNYQFWVDSPRSLLTASLGDFLRETKCFSGVSDDQTGADYQARGRIIQFERRKRGKTYEAVVAIDIVIRSSQRGDNLVAARYRAVKQVSDDSLSAFVAEMGYALDEVYSRLVQDLSERN